MRRICLVSALLPALLLCGCGGGEKGREPEDTVLAQVLGIDKIGAVYVLTAAGAGGTGETVIQTVEGESVAEAFAAMPGAGEMWMSLTNVSCILLGDGVEPRETLTFILNESGMSWRATVWQVLLAAPLMSGQPDGGAARLTVLEQSGAGGVTVLDALVGLEEEGETAFPALRAVDGRLTVVGKVHYAVEKTA